MLDLRELATAIGETAVLPTVGHELRTPLTSICGYLETVLDGELDVQTSRRFLETAQREARRLAELIDTLVSSNSPASTVRTIAPAVPKTCDVAELVGRVVETVAPLARRRFVTIRTTVPARAVARVGADECIHALTNLIENAIKHGRANGSIAVCARAEGDVVRIAVDDDGNGVVAGNGIVARHGNAAWSALFETGVRGQTSSPGCGIGLAIVRAIAHRAGGDVAIASSPLGGARFILQLPAG